MKILKTNNIKYKLKEKVIVTCKSKIRDKEVIQIGKTIYQVNEILSDEIFVAKKVGVIE